MSTASPTSSLTAEYINPIIKATVDVFEMMLECTPRRTGLSLKSNTSPSYELSAVIGVSGKAAGTIVLSLSLETALGVLEGMLGIQETEITSEVCDAAGELTNMIAGSAKAQLEQHELSISIPNIISGVGHEIHYPSSVQPFCLTFESDLGPFAIEVGFTST
ncbi:Chemotaxis protein CheX [hydrothermal vent metagenome]|uniref:Chemotaxis protein CheX n=1 Tax=hydrothermal vent metagenome TaxID=652676 RepID=A0A3B1DAH1_9ZZZZ